MGASISALVVAAGLTLGNPWSQPYPTKGAKNPNPAPAEVLQHYIPLGSDGHNHTMQRAGHPSCISKWALPGVTSAYCGYYVGGGCILPGRAGPPGPLCGTFGWDYCCNKVFCHRVILGWCCPKRSKGGTGAYTTDGPPVPNIFAIHLPESEEHPDEHHGEAVHGCPPTYHGKHHRGRHR